MVNVKFTCEPYGLLRLITAGNLHVQNYFPPIYRKLRLTSRATGKFPVGHQRRLTA